MAKMQEVSLIDVMDFVISHFGTDKSEVINFDEFEVLVAQEFETTQLAARAIVQDVLYLVGAGTDFVELDNRLNKLTARTSGFRFGPDRSHAN